jgi:hypothetical protein
MKLPCVVKKCGLSFSINDSPEERIICPTKESISGIASERSNYSKGTFVPHFTRQVEKYNE